MDEAHFGEEKRSPMPQCPTCGAKVSENAEMCPDCGMDFRDVPAAEMEREPTSVSDVPSSSEPVAQELSLEPSQGLAHFTLKCSGVLTKQTFPCGKRVVVGRFDPNRRPVDIDLGSLPESSFISRCHAEIWCDENGQWFIKDMGSRNGTFVCGSGETEFRRIADEQIIQDGDEFALGNVHFEFRVT
jgi:hypothetical protein